jgi:hypothetical protein
MKLRLQVVILTMALLVAGAGSAFATPLDPHVEPVVPGPAGPGCTLQERGGEIELYQAFGGTNGAPVTLTSHAFYRPGAVLRVSFFGRSDFGQETVFNPRTGLYHTRPIVGVTAKSEKILLPAITVPVDLTVPRP